MDKNDKILQEYLTKKDMYYKTIECKKSMENIMNRLEETLSRAAFYLFAFNK